MVFVLLSTPLHSRRASGLAPMFQFRQPTWERQHTQVHLARTRPTSDAAVGRAQAQALAQALRHMRPLQKPPAASHSNRHHIADKIGVLFRICT
jgi:hypothetical protein